MLLKNNPRLDPSQLEEHVSRLQALRRRESIVPPLTASPVLLTGRSMTLPWRQRMKTIPVLGTVAVFFYRRWRHFRVPGLSRRERLKRFPILGPLVYLVYTLRHLSGFRIETLQRLESLGHRLAEEQRQVTALRQELEALHQVLNERLDAQRNTTEAALASLAEQTAEVYRSTDNRLVQHTRAIRHLEQSLPSAQTPDRSLPQTTGAPTVSSTMDLGLFYLEFEDRFRGKREDIRERLKTAYLDIVRLAAKGKAKPRAVDIGCGRGEWLELLAAEGWSPLGIDLDAGMASTCQAAGFEVHHGDGIAWLEAQPEGSLDMVTGFHVIEHLPFDSFVMLMDATLRALAPNGVAIFETPNPENLQVGACNFYMDPTHRHPIPPAAAAFIAEQRGYGKIEIRRLHPYPQDAHIAEESATALRLNHFLYGPQDYALIAWKNHAA